MTDKGVETLPFLEASDGLVDMFGATPRSTRTSVTEDLEVVFETFFILSLSCCTGLDLLGSGVFGFVQSDIRSNIAVRYSVPHLKYGSSQESRVSGRAGHVQLHGRLERLGNA